MAPSVPSLGSVCKGARPSPGPRGGGPRGSGGCHSATQHCRALRALSNAACVGQNAHVPEWRESWERGLRSQGFCIKRPEAWATEEPPSFALFCWEELEGSVLDKPQAAVVARPVGADLVLGPPWSSAAGRVPLWWTCPVTSPVALGVVGLCGAVAVATRQGLVQWAGTQGTPLCHVHPTTSVTAQTPCSSQRGSYRTDLVTYLASGGRGTACLRNGFF